MRSSGVDREVWFRAYLVRLASLGPDASLDTLRHGPATAGDIAVVKYRERFPDDASASESPFDFDLGAFGVGRSTPFCPTPGCRLTTIHTEAECDLGEP